MLSVGCVTLLLYIVNVGVAEDAHAQTQRYSVNSNRRLRSGYAPAQTCNTAEIIYELAQLDSHADERSRHLNSHLRVTSERLQNLEDHNENIRRSVDELLGEFRRSKSEEQPLRLARKSPPDVDALNAQLSPGERLILAAISKLNSDVESLKRNFSKIVNHTNVMLQNANIPKSCKEIYKKGNSSESGIYLIKPPTSPESFLVRCEMRTEGGGWTYIHNRVDGSQDFFQDYQNYKLGFGNLAGDFWLGLEHIHHLTSQNLNELYIELANQNDQMSYARYDMFSIGSYSQGYPLNGLGKYTGDSGDSLSYHAGAKFSTKDHDEDSWEEGSCALSHKGGWWYQNCDRSNLNGLYIKGITFGDQMYQGMYWNDFGGPFSSLKAARMMIREKDL